jgi:hypothetical protein
LQFQYIILFGFAGVFASASTTGLFLLPEQVNNKQTTSNNTANDMIAVRFLKLNLFMGAKILKKDEK